MQAFKTVEVYWIDLSDLASTIEYNISTFSTIETEEWLSILMALTRKASILALLQAGIEVKAETRRSDAVQLTSPR